MFQLIYTEAFQYNCLQDIQISSKNIHCFSVDGVAYGKENILLVPHKWKGTKLVIPDTVTYINTHQIYGSKIQEIVLHKNVREIARDDLSLDGYGDSLEWGYGKNEFQDQKHLKKITLQKGSKYYKIKDGALYKIEGKGKYEFEGYPEANISRKKIRIIEGTTRLDTMLVKQKGLKLVLPKSLKTFRSGYIFSKINVSVRKGNKFLVKYRNGIYNKKKTELCYFFHTNDKSASIYIPPSLEKIKCSQLFDTRKVRVYIKGGKQSRQWKKLKKQNWYTGKLVVRSY